MRKIDFDNMNRSELAYSLLLSKMYFYRETFKKVTLLKTHNSNGRITSNIVCYLEDLQGTTYTDSFRFADEDYIWFLNTVSNDFPEVDFVDLTAEGDKLGNANAV